MTTRRFTIKEPTEAEFRAFKADFLKSKAQGYYDQDTKRQIEDLMRINGELQSEKDELKDKLLNWHSKFKSQNNFVFVGMLKLNKKQLNYATLKKFTHQMLNDLLWMELRSGKFYHD